MHHRGQLLTIKTKLMKTVHQVMTRAVDHQYNRVEKAVLFEAFQILIKAFPKEYHFAIHLCTADEGQGQKIWFIIDESEVERIETMLLPEDY